MTIEKQHSVLEKDWYFATQTLPEYNGNFAHAIGMGDSHAKAIENCIHDILLIKKLQANIK